MTTPIANMEATFANSSYRYDAIAMNVNADSYAANSTLLNLKKNDDTKFSIDIEGNAYINANVRIDGSIVIGDSLGRDNLTVQNMLTGNTVVANTINVNETIVFNIGKANTFVSTYSNASYGNVTTFTATHSNATHINATSSLKVAGNSVFGNQTAYFKATALTPTETNGAEFDISELETNDVVVSALLFDPTTSEHAQLSFKAPKNWNLGTLQLRYEWSQRGAASGGVVWTAKGRAFGDGDALDAAWGTQIHVEDIQTTANDMSHTNVVTLTLAGTPTIGDTVTIDVSRSTANGSDTMAVDARLHGVEMIYGTVSPTDD